MPVRAKKVPPALKHGGYSASDYAPAGLLEEDKYPNNESERLARRRDANAAALVHQQPSPLTVMLVKMRFEYAVAKAEAAKGRTAYQNVIRKALDSAHATAKDCAPYVHRRLSSLNASQAQPDLSILSDEELEALEKIAEKLESTTTSSMMDSTSH